MIGQLLGAARTRRTIDGLVEHVANASLENASRLTADRTTGMSPWEARGYVRARAGREVRRQARMALESHPELASAHEAIARRASDRVASLVLRRLSAAASPRNRVAPRRAA